MARKQTSNSAQSLVETVFIVPIIAAIIIVIGWFARIMLTRQQLLMAARYGTDMITYTDLSEQQIRREIKDYLCGEHVEGRKLYPRQLNEDTIKIRIYRDTSSLFHPYGFNEVDRNSSCVELFYKVGIPPMLVPVFDRGKNTDGLYISARSVVLAGTWCREERF